MANKIIGIGAFSRAQCEAFKGQVQTFGHELLRPLNLDSHSVKPPKAMPKVQWKKDHPTLFHAQNNPSNLTVKILLVFKKNYGKKSTTSRPKFGIPFMSDPNFLRGFIALIKKIRYVDILESNSLWTLASSVKG